MAKTSALLLVLLYGLLPSSALAQATVADSCKLRMGTNLSGPDGVRRLARFVKG